MALRTNAVKDLTLREEEEEEEEDSYRVEEEEEEEYTEEEEETYKQNVSALKRGPPSLSLSNERGKRQCTRPLTSHHYQLQVTCPLHDL